MATRLFTFAVALFVASSACGQPASGKVAPRNPNLITAEEIAKSNAATAYEAVKRLRPEFLRTRGVTSTHSMQAPTPVVYVDGSLYGPLSALSGITATSIATIEYMNAIDATQRFGIGHDAGAILVTTRR